MSDPLSPMPLQSVAVLGVQIDRIDFTALLAQIGIWVEESREASATIRCRQICTVNPEFIMEASRNPYFAATLSRADLRAPDGVGVLWAARVNGMQLNERVTGSDGIYRICERAALAGWRVFFLGAAPGIAELTTAVLKERYPKLNITGVYSGSPAAEDWAGIQRRLAASQPDILFVAFGHPKQDIWIDVHRNDLPVAVAIGVGGAFDFVAGVTVRAPIWVQRLGMEWLYRLLREPWRWRRMSKLPLFVLQVLWEKLTR